MCQKYLNKQHWKYIPYKNFSIFYLIYSKNPKANSVIQLRLVLGCCWHINVTVKCLKMWNPKKK